MGDMMKEVNKHSSEKSVVDFKSHKCPESGGVYQELPTLGSFADALDGSRVQRITNNCYNKVHLKKEPKLLETLLNVDNGGPPFDNVSRPHRIF